MTFDINFIVLLCLNLKIGEGKMCKNISTLISSLFCKKVFANQLLNKEFFLVPRNKYLTPCAEIASCKNFVLDKLSVANLKYQTSDDIY